MRVICTCVTDFDERALSVDNQAVHPALPGLLSNQHQKQKEQGEVDKGGKREIEEKTTTKCKE